MEGSREFIGPHITLPIPVTTVQALWALTWSLPWPPNWSPASTLVLCKLFSTRQPEGSCLASAQNLQEYQLSPRGMGKVVHKALHNPAPHLSEPLSASSFLPHFLHSSHPGLLGVPQTLQARSCLRTFAYAIPSVLKHSSHRGKYCLLVLPLQAVDQMSPSQWGLPTNTLLRPQLLSPPWNCVVSFLALFF